MTVRMLVPFAGVAGEEALVLEAKEEEGCSVADFLTLLLLTMGSTFREDSGRLLLLPLEGKVLERLLHSLLALLEARGAQDE